MKKQLIICAAALLTTAAFAKLPTPVLTDEAKAKAAEAAAKTAHGNKLANYQLCKSMDRTAAHYFKTAKAAGKEIKPATDTGACADPGAFVWPAPAAPAATAPAAPAVATAAPAKPAAPAAPVKK
ncbi:hypothetical protein [Variovorax sp. PCZ-1]|uniref:hypothetical protein n=1 Tax=Variovorax sp. PCZ-1 TaxID=2835533 RepID=UPI001BCB08FB|nr:hypothetical protein [Variovorax sp. PCZ-1]MBS7807582.1 hypothetical protein [Variovorax sp. PCZ-1]